MCTERQHDAENVRLRAEVVHLQAQLDISKKHVRHQMDANGDLMRQLKAAKADLADRVTATNWPAWRMTFQSDGQAAKAAFAALIEARQENEHLKTMIDHGIA